MPYGPIAQFLDKSVITVAEDKKYALWAYSSVG